VRGPLPFWLRTFTPGAFAMDYLLTAYRYRPFSEDADFDESKPGYLANVLAGGPLFVPFAQTFNDPWEAAPRIEVPPWSRDPAQSLSEFMAFMAGKIDRAEVARIKAMMRGLPIPAIKDRMQEELLKMLRKTPILSLSDRPDNFLMWSYYGKGHYGYALMFDTKKMPAGAAFRVRYSRRHPVILTSRRDMRGVAVDVLATKARQWRHEREWRVITSTNASPEMGLSNPTILARGVLFDIPKDALVGVIVGDQLCRSPLHNRLFELLKKHSPRLHQWVAEIDRHRFRIVMRPVRYA
jgi:hypothetical protein